MAKLSRNDGLNFPCAIYSSGFQGHFTRDLKYPNVILNNCAPSFRYTAAWEVYWYNRQNLKRKKKRDLKNCQLPPTTPLLPHCCPSRTRQDKGHSRTWGPGQHEALFSNGASITILCFRVTSQGSSTNIFNWCYQEVKSFQVKNLAANAGAAGSTPGSGRSAAEGMATHSSILSWRIPWTEEPRRYSPWSRKESNTV